MKRTTVTILPPRQRGAALIVGLMLLLVLTLLAVSGITTSTLELSMAGNTQQAQYAFQAADSGIDSEMISGTPINYTGAEVAGDLVRGPTQYDYPDSTDPVASTEVTTLFRQQSLASESQMRLHFEVRSEADTTERGGRSVQRGGFYVLAPVPQ